MAETSKIEWTDATWNPITGCTVVSPGCTNCYAMRLAGTRMQHHPSRAGLTKPSKAGPVWTGEVRFNEDWLDQPLRWRRSRMIFVCAHGDLFHPGVPFDVIDKVFAVMALAHWHTFQVLTKRAERMRAYASSRFGGEFNLHISEAGHDLPHGLSEDETQAAVDWTDLGKPLPNVWLGVSVEDQRRADERIPDQLATPAAIRFVSAEPLLGPVVICPDCARGHRPMMDGRKDRRHQYHIGVGQIGDACGFNGIDWVIAGGESGPGARPMHPAWARSLRDQCQAAGVAFHFKQWGAWATPSAAGNIPFVRGNGDLLWQREDGRTRPGVEADAIEREEEAHGAPLFVLQRRVGKEAAGRLLDGRTWDEMPEARP